ASINYTKFELSNFITVFRVGPVRLLFTYLAILYRVFKVYVVNYIKKRLTLAASISAILINFINKDPIT
ncbi:alcohol dehydrogenase GroES-like domain-containing protein, partial [Colletotrichum filicis]